MTLPRMLLFLRLPALLMLCGLSAACTAGLGGGARSAPVDPAVEVTRFHAAERIDQVGQGNVAIIAVDSKQAASSAYRALETALGNQLRGLGYTVVSEPSLARQTALLGYQVIDPSIDSEATLLGGGPPAFNGQAVGATLNIPFGGPRRDILVYRAEVRLALRSDSEAQSAADSTIWEGRAIQKVQVGTSGTKPETFAPVLMRALFSDFPGASGKTIAVP